MMGGIIKNPSRLDNMRREICRVGGFSRECRNYLKSQLLELASVIAHAGFLTVALAKFYSAETGDHTFVIDLDGEPAAIIEALAFDSDREQVTADYVAWPLADPYAYATALGLNDGADVLGPANMVQRGGKPLVIHRTPLEWLQAGGEGCVMLKPGSPVACQWLARAGGPFIAQDIAHGREIRAMLGRVAARHRILVPQAEASAA
jgi:hypothetical protein